MNLYIRYFDKETLVGNADDAIAFLHSIPGLNLAREQEDDIRDYAQSDVFFPKRYKVRPRVYFIIIKTTAQSMQDFKEKKAVRPTGEGGASRREIAASVATRLTAQQPGWYEGEIDFKRVILIPGTGKHEYRDTHFVADVKADSPIDCYNRIVDHLKQMVDPRSQFPSAKGKNFHFKYLGAWK